MNKNYVVNISLPNTATFKVVSYSHGLDKSPVGLIINEDMGDLRHFEISANESFFVSINNNNIHAVSIQAQETIK